MNRPAENNNCSWVYGGIFLFCFCEFEIILEIIVSDLRHFELLNCVDLLLDSNVSTPHCLYSLRMRISVSCVSLSHISLDPRLILIFNFKLNKNSNVLQLSCKTFFLTCLHFSFLHPTFLFASALTDLHVYLFSAASHASSERNIHINSEYLI